MKREPVIIHETKDGVFINGVMQQGVLDVQVKENSHELVTVEMTYLADEFLKKNFSDGLGDSR